MQKHMKKLSFGMTDLLRQARTGLRTGLCAALLAAGAAGAGAATVSYQATDLADTTVGQDLWQLDYTVGGAMPVFWSWNLLFDPARYASLALLANSAPSDLDVLLTEPDTGLPADGLAGLTALTDLDAAFSAQVSLSLVWLGTGAPGAQPFEVVDDSFNVQSRSTTTAAGTGGGTVPEPGTAWLLLACGAAAVAASRRRKA